MKQGIRHSNDYDDFYVVSAEEGQRQIETAEELIGLVEAYCDEKKE